MRKFLSIVLALAMTAALFAGCSATDSPSAAAGSEATSQAEAGSEAAKTVKIGVSVANLANSFYLEIKEGLESSLNKGDQLSITDANLDSAKQINDIEDMVQQKMDIILVDPVDSKGIKSALDSCAKANIPVIAFNSPVDDVDLVKSTVASDNYMAGELIAEALAKAINEKGNIAMYNYSVVKVCKDRGDGFEAGIAKYPNIKIVNKQEGKPATDASLPVMENILQANPDIVGVFALNDPAAIGCIAAIESAGKINQIKVVGVDGSKDGRSMITNGKMLASAAQFPKQIGSVSIETAYKILAGEKVEADIKIPVELVDKSNAAS
ncbi:sugar ABC transporter substrate-binding protein [Caproiciproducens sp. CPB-2]|uniref:sugar ABC transporter substrate-binding protein n=1 Tax=Caproiciproducens sp. CPB-2 TaxID=3030017 RepID=UPI0023DBAE5B|nr:sugar ABC transporter substrate-binding protein [Caproiciproducens sp. CPB-2]MDF1496405.1 sugar ABC transporter substrate-binding protein [Caproiciproducens sp. CPB-2]